MPGSSRKVAVVLRDSSPSMRRCCSSTCCSSQPQLYPIMSRGRRKDGKGKRRQQGFQGLANFNMEYKINFMKETNYVECSPKERHLNEICFAITVNRPRADVAFSISTFARRFPKTKNWFVADALKTLTVIHRLLKESYGTFKGDFLRKKQVSFR